MPYWNIHHPDDVLRDDAEKDAIAKAITEIYTAVPLPAFYSSAQEPTFIHVRFTHIARQFPPGESEKKDKFLDRVTEILKPFTIDKGWYLELTGEEGDRSLLRVQGMKIPPPGSEDEKKWVAENAAVPYGPYLSRI
ncbi:Tautomerase [Metarhizium brunneum]